MKTVLKLTTAPTATRHVEIDGRRYPLRPPETMKMDAAQQASALCIKLGTLLQKKTLMPAETREAAALLAKTIPLIVDAPAAVHRRLQDSHRMAVLTAWTQAYPPRRK